MLFKLELIYTVKLPNVCSDSVTMARDCHTYCRETSYTAGIWLNNRCNCHSEFKNLTFANQREKKINKLVTLLYFLPSSINN